MGVGAYQFLLSSLGMQGSLCRCAGQSRSLSIQRYIFYTIYVFMEKQEGFTCISHLEPRSALISCHQMIPAFNAIKMVKVEINSKV